MISSTLPWQIRYEPGVPVDVPLPAEPFHSLLATAAADAPGYPALHYFNRRLSYAALDAAVTRLAGACLRAGLQPGEAVFVALPDGVAAAVASLGVMRAGGLLVPLPPQREALAAAMGQVEPALAIVSSSLTAAFERKLPARGLVEVSPEQFLPRTLRLLRRISGRGGPGRRGPARGWDSWQSGGPSVDLPRLEPDAPALLQISDVSGIPPVAFSHRHLVAGAGLLRAWLTDARPGDDSWLLLAPLSSVFGLTVGLGSAVMLRARILLMPGRDPDSIADALSILRPAYVMDSGQTTAALVARPELAHMDLRSVRAWITAADLGVATSAAFSAATGLDLCQGYGPPGVAGLATCNPINGRRVEGSVGVPLPGVDFRLLGPREGLGRLDLAGPNVVAAPWLTTERRARIDGAGFLHIGKARP
jgi:long-chain acyl-CoA synthetase